MFAGRTRAAGRIAIAGAADVAVSASLVPAPANTPPAITAKLNHAIGELLKRPDVTKKWASFRIDAVPTTSDELRKILAQEVRDFTNAARRASISIQ
jgi:tripartite-type tricarboxylate transporter receptor subunit TctC